MDVTPFGQVLPHELDIGGSGVVFQDGFANFLEVEIAALRDRFIPSNNFDRDAYEDLFDASKDLVRSTLEQIWSERFEWGDIKKEILRVEKSKTKYGRHLEEDLKPELDNLPIWRRTPLGYWKPGRQLEDVRMQLNKLWNDLNEVYIMKGKKHNLFNIATYKTSRKLEQLEKSIQGEEHSIAGDLQLLLVRRQREAIQADAIEFEAFDKFFKEKVAVILEFIEEWRCWCKKVDLRIFKTSFPILLILIAVDLYAFFTRHRRS